MPFQAVPALARRLLLPYARSAHPVLRSLSSVAPTYGGDEHHRHWDEEGGKAVRVTVWWDFEKCRLPPGVSAFRLGTRVTAALRGAGIWGPLGINAFGDVSVLTQDEQAALAATGVSFSHVPRSEKNSCDRSFMADLMYWIAQNPPPAHFFLISGDKEFANILHRLRMSNYNILLACPEVGSKTLRSAATIMWPWEPLVKGVNLSPTHVNQPPDGSSSSWYGDYMGPLDIELLKSKDLMASPRNTTVPRLPKSVADGIKKVLWFYPEGISLTNLRAELKKANVPIDRGYFGYGKFSSLLHAMPDVVKFIDPLPGESQPAVVGDFRRSVESSEQDFEAVDSSQSNIEEKHLNEAESDDLSARVSQSSSSELSSRAQKKTQQADAPSSRSNQLSISQRETPDLTQGEETLSNRAEPDISMAKDVPSADALSRDQRNVQPVNPVTQTEPQISHTEADMVAAASAPTSGAQVNVSKKELFGRILTLWNGQAH